MTVNFSQARWIEPSNKHELNLSKNAVSQQQLAKDRLAIKALKEKMPDRVFHLQEL